MRAAPALLRSALAATLLASAAALAQSAESETREVPDFEGVSVGSAIRAEVRVGPKSVRLEGPAAERAKVKVSVKDGVLVAESTREGFWRGSRGVKDVRMVVTSPKVTRVHGGGAAEVDAEASKADAFSAESDGAAKVTVRNVDARTVRAEASGGSQVAVAGRAEEVQAECSGGARVSTVELQGVKSLTAEASGGARIEADAKEKVKVEASGGATVRLRSRPGVSDVDTSGGARVVYGD